MCKSLTKRYVLVAAVIFAALASVTQIEFQPREPIEMPELHSPIKPPAMTKRKAQMDFVREYKARRKLEMGFPQPPDTSRSSNK